MTNRNRLLYALVLLPTLLLTSCYKDFDKVRVKPFKPDLVVPVATADSITFADMLVKGGDKGELDSSYDDKRIGLRYDAFVYNKFVLKLSPSLKKLTINGGNVSKDELFPRNSNPLRVQKIVFAKGAAISANKHVILTLENGSKLELNTGFRAPLEKPYTLKLPIDASIDCILTFKDEKKSVEAVEVKIESLQELGNVPPTVTLNTYDGLLWYSGELTDPRVAVKITTGGWTTQVEKLKYWVEGFLVKTRVGGKEEEKPLVGKVGENPLPFNENGKSEFFAYWEKGATQEEEYFLKQTSMLNFSTDWPVSYTVGKLGVECKDQVVTVHAGEEEEGSVRTDVALKLPFTGQFNALIREFKGGDEDGNIELPDVNKLLQDSGGKVKVKSSFADNDTVLLHFYFKNATPMDIYLAAKVGDLNAVPKGAKSMKAAKFDNKDSKIGEQEIKGTRYKLDDFEFFKAVGGADVGGPYGIVKEGGAVQSNVATIKIPYNEYEKARKTNTVRQLTALLLFRSPEGNDGKPIVVSPRLIDYASIRLGVEVKPEVSIELKNKK